MKPLKFLVALTLAGVLASRPAAHASPDSVVVFNEVHYNPVGQTEDGEWIELFNQMGIMTDVSGWRIEGIGYTFPANTFIDPGGYLVVAKTPGAGQFGPFDGSLENGGERLRLINQGERLMDELTYGDDGRWPEAADGSGVTLAKRNRYTANKPPENWAPSAQVGGTPGANNFPTPAAGSAVVLNEMPPASEDPFWIELANKGASEAVLGGMVLTAGADPLRRYVIPAQELAAGAFLVVTEAELGFRPALGEKLFLSDAAEVTVLDARELTGRLRGRAETHAGAWLYPDEPTAGASNSFVFHDEVVISEIMYNPPAIPAPAGSSRVVENSDNQWIEIANRSGATVALDGWEFSDGINFTFSEGTNLGPGEHACVVRDADAFAAAYSGTRSLGVFSGSLSRSGERIHLRDENKNPVDEVRYFDSGRWPENADGGGSSLELRDLEADNSVAESWAASNERAQTAWQTYVYQGRASASRGPDSKWSEFNIGLLGEGELLIDDIQVLENRRTDKIGNGDFNGNVSGWRFRGTHRHSEIVDDPDDPDNKVLRLVATGATGHMHNQIETTLLSPVNNGQSYVIRFRARWVSGSNQLHTRLYFNRLPAVSMIERPLHVGTPSAPNSRAEANIGPSIRDFMHFPAVPAVGENVTVTARASDPDGVTGVSLFYSVRGAPFRSVPMTATQEGHYAGIIPRQAAASVVQFYVEASDAQGVSASFPAAGPDSRALYKVDDGLAATNGQHNFRIVVTDAERDFIHERIEVMSNDRIGATIIDREEDIYYDVKLRLKGSQRARAQDNRVGYNMRFGRDALYRGIHRSLAIDRSEGVGQGQIEILFDIMIANSGGVISRYYDFIKVLAPKNQHTRSAVLQMARYDDVLLDSQFPNGSDGNLYEFELIYSPNAADGNGYKLPNPDGVNGVSVGNLGDDKEFYRWFFLKKNNREADDFAPIIAYNKKFSQSGAAFEQGLEEVIDVDGWFRGMAYAVLSGAGDNAGAGSAHNGMYYAHPDGRVMFLPHDMDFAFSTTRSIYANGECARLTADPLRKRIYLGHLRDIISTTYNPRYMSRWTSHLASFDPGQNWSGHLNYITGRFGYVRSQIALQIASVDFAITTTDPLVVGTSNARIWGDGWVNVREVRLEGATAPLALTWTDEDSWQVTLPVARGEHDYTLEAVDFSGRVVGRASISIENTGMGEPASSENLAITELMYHPGAPTSSEIAAGFADDDFFEFIELTNIGSNPVDLTGVSFTAGINHALPSTTIPPGGRRLVVRNRAAFLNRYPGTASFILDGEYVGGGDTNKLSNDGEEVVLSDAAGSDIRRFTYGDSGLWPSSPDGNGPSLVLIYPPGNPLPEDPMSWRTSTATGGNPGASDAGAPFSGDPNFDGDKDGLSAFLEHAMGTNDGSADLSASPVLGRGLFADGSGGQEEFLTISYRRNLAADDVIYEVQVGSDLENWSTIGTRYLGSTNHFDGTETVSVRSATPLATLPNEFIRLHVYARVQN